MNSAEARRILFKRLRHCLAVLSFLILGFELKVCIAAIDVNINTNISDKLASDKLQGASGGKSPISVDKLYTNLEDTLNKDKGYFVADNRVFDTIEFNKNNAAEHDDDYIAKEPPYQIFEDLRNKRQRLPDAVVDNLEEDPFGLNTNVVGTGPNKSEAPHLAPPVDGVCLPGQIWYNNQCVACTNYPEWVKTIKQWRMYCPGYYSDELKPFPFKQLQKCPKGALPKDDLTGCECVYSSSGHVTNSTTRGFFLISCGAITLTEEDLRCGPGGCAGKPLHDQCWTKQTPASYRVCMGFE